MVNGKRQRFVFLLALCAWLALLCLPAVAGVSAVASSCDTHTASAQQHGHDCCAQHMQHDGSGCACAGLGATDAVRPVLPHLTQRPDSLMHAPLVAAVLSPAPSPLLKPPRD